MCGGILRGLAGIQLFGSLKRLGEKGTSMARIRIENKSPRIPLIIQ